MSNLRDRIAKALRTTMFGNPDWAFVGNPYQLTDTLLSLPGIAIVELPEPQDDEQIWPIGDHAHVCVLSGFVHQDGHLYDATEARELAAALLAAANAAEAK